MELNLFNNINQRKSFILTEDNFIGKGSVGLVYRNEDRCFKHLKWYNRWQVNTIVKMLENLKLIEHSCLCKLHDLYYVKENDITSLVGYEMDYYDANDLNILHSSIDYILDNFHDLIILVSEITKKGISIEDLHYGNVILQANRIVVIDVDNYHFCDLEYAELFYKNCKQLKLLLRGMLLESIRKSGLEEDMHWEYLKSFELIKYNNDVDIECILQELKKYNTPFEFIKKYK